MEERQEVLSRLNYEKIYKKKISEEFSFNLPRNEKAEVVYHALVKEQKLYLYYATAAAVLFNAFWDFGDSTKRVVPLIKEWEKCTLEDDNYQSFIHLMDAYFSQSEVNKEVINKWHANFSLLFADPKILESNIRDEMLLFLCRINAFHSLRIFFKLHYPAIEVNFPHLLREAIGCLHSETVQTLVDSGANIHDYFHTPAYLDYGIHTFMPPLYYAVWIPNDPYCTLHRDGPKILWDNPKLENMIKTLLFLGANPEQNCLVAPKLGGENISTLQDKTEVKENVITFAQGIITDQESISKLNQESLVFLNGIAKLTQRKDLNTQQEEENSPMNMCLIL